MEERPMNVKNLHKLQAAGLLSHPHQHGALTRRQFLKAGITALAAGYGLGRPSTAWASPLAVSPADPHPIPYGTQFLYPDPTIFHAQAPGYPLPNPPFDSNPATNDPSAITDFNGFVGLMYVGGQGTHRDLVTGETASLYWEVDMRFMVGEYIGADGRKRTGTFGFV
jgi:hypothetical protein